MLLVLLLVDVNTAGAEDHTCAKHVIALSPATF